MLRAAKPKLSLAVPSTSHIAASGPKSPFPLPVSPSPINSPTARNTLLNQRGYSTFQAPTYAYAQPSNTTAKKSILKKNVPTTVVTTSNGKRIQFNDAPSIKCVSPMPADYHGEYIKMSRDEKRWGKAPA